MNSRWLKRHDAITRGNPPTIALRMKRGRKESSPTSRAPGNESWPNAKTSLAVVKSGSRDFPTIPSSGRRLLFCFDRCAKSIQQQCPGGSRHDQSQAAGNASPPSARARRNSRRFDGALRKRELRFAVAAPPSASFGRHAEAPRSATSRRRRRCSPSRPARCASTRSTSRRAPLRAAGGAAAGAIAGGRRRVRRATSAAAHSCA